MPVRSRLLLALCLAPLTLLAACTAAPGQSGTAVPTATPAPTITTAPTTIALPAIPISGSVFSGVDAATPTPRGSVTAVRTGSATTTRTRTITPTPAAASATPAAPGSATMSAPPPAPPSPAPATATAGPGLGGQLAYVANNQILARQPGAAAVITLVADPGAGAGGNPTHLRWAPSGRRLLYTLEPAGAVTRTQVLVYDADNGQLQNLGTGLSPAWAADSDHVAWTRTGLDNTPQIVVATLSTGQQASLGLGQAPAWLPDGRQLAVVRDGNIGLLAVPGGTATQLTHFAPTGDDRWAILFLAYHYSGHLLFYGGQPRLLGAQGNGMGLYAADLATGAVQPWAMPGGNGLIALDIAPEGRYIALADQAHSSACASYGAVTLLDTATGHTTSIKLPATDARHAHVQGVSWAPQPAGRLAIAYSEFQCTPDQAGDLGPARIYLVDVTDPNTVRDEAPGAWPAWNRGREGLGAAPLPGAVFGTRLGGPSP